MSVRQEIYCPVRREIVVVLNGLCMLCGHAINYDDRIAGKVLICESGKKEKEPEDAAGLSESSDRKDEEIN